MSASTAVQLYLFGSWLLDNKKYCSFSNSEASRFRMSVHITEMFSRHALVQTCDPKSLLGPQFRPDCDERPDRAQSSARPGSVLCCAGNREKSSTLFASNGGRMLLYSRGGTGFPFCVGRVSNFYALYFELCVALAPFIFRSWFVHTAPHAHCVLKANTFSMFQPAAQLLTATGCSP